MNPDKYHGAEAFNYDRNRSRSSRWKNEQLAVDKMVTRGPVLDCPIGTGRYIPLYQVKRLDLVGADVSMDMIDVAKRYYGGFKAVRASVTSLPFADGCFETAVCTRLFDWLYPDQLEVAIAELRRVARRLVVTIRHGRAGEGSVNYTHDLRHFYSLIEGLHIEQRITTEITKDGHEEIFLAREPTFDDVLGALRYDSKNCWQTFRRLVREFHGVKVSRPLKVEAQFRTRESLMRVAQLTGFITDELPRFEGGPAILFSQGGWESIIDGRRRINHMGKMMPVLVVSQ